MTMGPRKLFLVFLLGSGVIFGYGSAILSLAHGGGAACHHSPPPPSTP